MTRIWNSELIQFRLNDAYLDFDGEKLRWIQNNKIKSIMDAQSGQDAYQCSFYQDIPDKGPLPEGKILCKTK